MLIIGALLLTQRFHPRSIFSNFSQHDFFRSTSFSQCRCFAPISPLFKNAVPTTNKHLWLWFISLPGIGLRRCGGELPFFSRWHSLLPTTLRFSHSDQGEWCFKYHLSFPVFRSSILVSPSSFWLLKQKSIACTSNGCLVLLQIWSPSSLWRGVPISALLSLYLSKSFLCCGLPHLKILIVACAFADLCAWSVEWHKSELVNDLSHPLPQYTGKEGR